MIADTKFIAAYDVQGSSTVRTSMLSNRRNRVV
jgi:hypothetical protein